MGVGDSLHFPLSPSSVPLRKIMFLDISQVFHESFLPSQENRAVRCVCLLPPVQHLKGHVFCPFEMSQRLLKREATKKNCKTTGGAHSIELAKSATYRLKQTGQVFPPCVIYKCVFLLVRRIRHQLHKVLLSFCLSPTLLSTGPFIASGKSPN